MQPVGEFDVNTTMCIMNGIYAHGGFIVIKPLCVWSRITAFITGG